MAAAGDNKTFTIMNHLPKDESVKIKEYQASTCHKDAPAKTFFCKFVYCPRLEEGIFDSYLNLKVCASTGPAKTYFMLERNGVYGSTQYENVGAAANKLSIC